MTRLRPQIHNGLHWVRAELDQNLNRARTLIEGYAEHPKDPLPLQQAYVELHQVRGTASMIQCYGVAAAAEEMKQAVQELMHGKLAEPEVAYSVLLGASAQLSDYIEAIDGGMDDCALVLQPMVNELRLVRGKSVLTECDIFVAQLQALNLALPAPDADSRLPGAARDQARKLLLLFQRSLLHWLRGSEDAMASVARMGRIGEQIAMHTRSAHIYLLWRCFSACAEALLAHALDDSLELKRLFGAAGRQIKLLAEVDEAGAEAQLGGLAYQFLFQVGRSSGQGSRVNGLRKVFSLSTYLPETAQLEQLRRKIRGPNATLLGKVAEEIRVDLNQIKDGIDMAVRSGGDTSRLKDTRQRLKRVGDTLSVLGLPVLHRVIVDQTEVLEQIPEGQSVVSDVWMDLATAILRVESSLEGALFRTLIQQNLDRAAGHAELEDRTPTLRDVREGRHALLREALVSLSRFKSGVDAFARKGEAGGLPEAGHMLAEIGAALRVLEENRAADELDKLGAFVRGPLVSQLRDSTERADRFADAVACLEYYLEALRDQLPDAARMLEDLATFAAAFVGEAPPAAEAVEPAPAPAAPVADEVDPEIRAVFVEEAGEVQSVLQTALPRWMRDVGDKNTLTEIRRAFHTLKGSGRMVGATDIGEFGWSIENLLNRCLDGTVPIGQPVVETVQQAVALLPALIAGFRDAQPMDTKLPALCARAQSLAAGLSGSEADPEMVGVFREDARERLQTISDWLARQDRARDAFAVEDELVRAFHTLRGAASLVKANAIHELAAQVESYLDSCRGAAHPLTQADLDLLAEIRDTLEQWIAGVGLPISASYDPKPWIERLQTVQEALPLHASDAASDRQLQEIFAGEAFELIEKLEELSGRWSKAPANRQLPAELQRAAHTLRGAALMSSCPALANVALALHDRVGEALAQSATPDEAFFRHLAVAYERLYQFLDSYREGASGGDGADLAQRLASIEFAGADMPPPSIPDAPADSQKTATEEVIEMLPVIEEITASAPSTEPVAEAPLAEAGPEPEPDPELLQIFLSEAQELLENFDTYSAAWEEHPDAAEPAAGLKRVLHTLKGSARMAGVESMGNLAHRVESAIAEVTRRGELPTPAFHARLHHVADGLHQGLDALNRGQKVDFDALLAELDAPLPEGSDEEEAIEMPPVATPEPFAEPAAPAVPPPAAAEPVPSQPRLDLTRTLVPGSSLAAATDDELIDTFRSEATELLEALGHSLDAWQSDPHNEPAMRDVQRALHTLKGGARMSGLMAMGSAAHAMEERIEQLEARRALADGELFGQLRADQDRLLNMQDLLLRGDTAALTDENFRPAVAEPLSPPVLEAQPPSPSAAGHAIEMPPVEVEAAVEPGIAEPATPPAETISAAPAVSFEPAPELTPEPAAAATPAIDYGPWDPALFWRPEQTSAGLLAMRRETARVPVEQLDDLLNQAGEISIYRSRLEEHNAGLGTQLAEMTAAIRRVREQLRLMDIETEAQIAARGLGPTEDKDRYEGQFDPLEMDRYTRMQELSRALSESVGDIANLRATMDELVSEAETLLLQQGRINSQLQQGLMGTLMVPFSRQAARLQRVVKQTAQAEGKQADIVFEGIDSELDRNVLERMTAPLEHLLRNSVVHGIEMPAERRDAGKPEQGTVHLSLRREGTQLLIELADDGAGLNLQAIREQAIRRGLLPADAQVADEALAQFIFEPGFSTAKTLTQAAGRGIGMDVVMAEVKQLGGTLELGSQAGKGARFLIRLPLNLALAQTLLVKAGGETYAVPLSSIDGIARIPTARLAELYREDGPLFDYGGSGYRVRYLGDFIGLPREIDAEQKSVSAVLVRVAEGLGAQERRVALVVDQLLGNREIVTKPVGPQVSSVAGVTGATILADGRVLLILDLQALTADRIRRAQITVGGEAPELPVAPVVPEQAEANLVMVVDDSITIRRVTERLLVKNGFRVVTAKDGLDAMAQLQTVHPAVVLLDIEMPRADGFEVAAFIRNSERIAGTPIVMITSRSGEKHRERARSIGVNRYMIKPYQEEQLMGEIRGVLQAPAEVAI
jgi:chemosensory pili system protein ChpA (sensor histidine kinase/response regulator)